MERELRDRAAAGDVEAFSELIRRYLPITFDFSSRLLRDQEAARSVVAEVVMDVADPAAHGAAESFRGLMLSRALEKCIARLRRQSGLGAQTLVLNGPVPESFCVSRQTAVPGEPLDAGLPILVWQVAASLDRRQFALLDLHSRHQLPAGEVSLVVGMPAASVEVTVLRMEEAVESAMEAVVVSQRGRRWCRDLDMLMADEDNLRISEATRKRVEDHVGICTACSQTGQRFGSCLAIYRSLQPIHPPPGLRAGVLAPAVSLLQERASEMPSRPPVVFRPAGSREPLVSVSGRIATLTTGLKVEGSGLSPISQKAPGESLQFRAAREPLYGPPPSSNGAQAYSYTPSETVHRSSRSPRSFYLSLGALAVAGLLGLGLLVFMTSDEEGAAPAAATLETESASTDDASERTLTFNASEIAFGASQSERVLTLQTNADSTVAWTITANQPWLSISPSGGSIEPGETIAVSLAVNRDNLPEGLHTATLVLATSDEQSELPVEVVIPGTGPSISDERLNAPQDPETGAPLVFQAGCEPEVTAFRVSALIEDPSGVARVSLIYAVGGDEPLEAEMDESGGRWEGAVPPLTRTGNIVYHIEATDEAGNTTTSTPVTVELRSCTGE